MGKVLLIEPGRILRQVISLALFPAHEVEAVETLDPARLSGGDYDLVIVDGDSLGAQTSATEVARRIEASKTPTLWLQEESDPTARERPGRVVLRKPLERAAFLAAVDELLAGEDASARAGAAVKGTAAGGVEAEPGVPEAAPAPIDLVEVVDEGPKRQGKRARQKSK